jgi:methylmalonyl-CoA decarboxylase subunit alpha
MLFSGPTGHQEEELSIPTLYLARHKTTGLVCAEKEAEYTKLFANPYNAAKYGYIDDVIEPRNTRFRIIRALQQLQTKKLSNPAKKHGNIPL